MNSGDFTIAKIAQEVLISAKVIAMWSPPLKRKQPRERDRPTALIAVAVAVDSQPMKRFLDLRICSPSRCPLDETRSLDMAQTRRITRPQKSGSLPRLGLLHGRKQHADDESCRLRRARTHRPGR